MNHPVSSLNYFCLLLECKSLKYPQLNKFVSLELVREVTTAEQGKHQVIDGIMIITFLLEHWNEIIPVSGCGKIPLVVIERGLRYDELSIVETDKVIHTVETDMVKPVVEIECFSKSFDEFDKGTGSSDGLQPKQANLSCIHALNEPHFARK
ncbi:hypothetical protein Tco_0632758 [Tanacetum coccineum]